jgi:hypothetical protein
MNEREPTMNSNSAKHSNLVAALTLISYLTVLATLAHAQQTDNYELRALPAPGPVVIDGKLDDWDLSGEIFSCYDIETLQDKHSVRTAALYDDRGLYLSFHVKDHTPMVNPFDPVNQSGHGWRSDCVQFRIWTDADKPYGPPAGGRFMHVTAYYYTDGKQPAASIAYHNMADKENGNEGSVTQAVGNGIDLAFQVDADGKGYTQEMRIDWKLLRRDGRPYKAGESLRMGLEFMWDELGGMPMHRYADLINKDNPKRQFFWTGNTAWGEVKFLGQGKVPPSPSINYLTEVAERLERQYETEGVVPLEYELEKDQRVTLVVEKPDGTRVRNLIADYPRNAGKNTDYWDGTDDDGNLVEPGEYRWRGLHRDELDVLYQFSYGNPGNPPWRTQDGRGDWLSDHERPLGVATDGQWIYLSAYMNERGDTVIGVDETGQRRWGVGRIGGGALAVLGQHLYMIDGGKHHDYGARVGEEGQIRLSRFDARSGKYVAFKDGKNGHVVATYPNRRDLPLPRFSGELVEQQAFDTDSCRMEAFGLAAAGNKLYLSMYYENKIIEIDPETGRAVGELALSKPTGLAGDEQGNLYAISDRQVVKLSKNKTFEPVVTAGLKAPVGLALDAAGNLYVSDWGDQMCVKVFSPDGKLLREIGSKGGRPLLGTYDPNGMFLPWGMAVDATNRLWVAEWDFQPKRVSVWDAASGQLVREYCGPGYYGGRSNSVDPLDPNRAFSLGNTLELDWEKGLWRVAGTLWRPTKANAFFGPQASIIETISHDGRKLLVTPGGRGYFSVSELGPNGARPLMARGNLAFWREWPLPEMILNKMWDDPAMADWAKRQFPGLFQGTVYHSHREFGRMVKMAENKGKPTRTEFLWTDGNGDGLVDDDELRLFTPQEANGLKFTDFWRGGYDADLTQFLSVDGKLWRWPVREWNSAGAPVYDPADAKVHAESTGDNWANARGNVVVNHASAGATPGGLKNASPLTGVDPDGQVQWTYPNRWPGVHASHRAPQARNGLLIGPLYVIGSSDLGGDIGEVFCLNGNTGQAFLFTLDGLYVGSLFKDKRSAPDAMPDKPLRGVSLMSTTSGGEWFGGQFFRNQQNGKTYVANGGIGTDLSEVTGLDSLRRLPPRRFTFTPALRAEAKTLLDKRGSDDSKEHLVTVRKLPTAPENLPLPTGAFDWSEVNSARWRYDQSRAAEATWTFDDRNLHLCFRNVDDSTPMVNGGNLVTRLFKTGDAAVFELRVTPDNRDANVLPGDFRLLFSVFEGKPVAVLYRYKALPEETPAGETFESPVLQTHVEVVKVLDSAKIAIDRRANGYDLRASVPLYELGLKPDGGKSYCGDFGIIYSDVQGQVNDLRMHWANQVTGLVDDLAGEAAIRPANWGNFSIEKKP